MVVHFAASVWNYDEDRVYIDTILSSIKNAGANLALDWLSPAYEHILRQEPGYYQVNMQGLVREDMDATMRSDAVILEMSAYRLPQGLQLGFALQYKKPISKSF